MPPQAVKPSGFWCTFCGKKFTRKEHLERHVPHHTGFKPYNCDQCYMSFGRQDLLRRHQAIYHSLKDGLDPIPSRAGSHKPDVACSNCHRAKCLCDKQKPSCGSCEKKGIPCVPRESKRVVKQETRASRSAAPQPPAPPAQLPLPASPAPPAQPPLAAQPAPDEHNQQEPAMEASLEAMINGDAYQLERRASDAQLVLQQGTGSQSSFMPEMPFAGNLAPGGPFPMNEFDFPNLNYNSFDVYGNPVQSFNPKDANFGSQNDPFLNIPDLTSPIELGLEDVDGIADLGGVANYGGVADYGGFATNDNTHHSLAGNQKGFKYIGQNDGSASAQHRSQMSQPFLPNKQNDSLRRLEEFRQSTQNKENAIHSFGQHQDGFHHFGQINDNSTFAPAVRQQVFPYFEPNNDGVISLPAKPHQDFSMVSSYGLPSPAKTTPSPPPSGSYAQLEGDKPAATGAEFEAALIEQWKADFPNVPFESFRRFFLANNNLIKKSGML